MWKMAWALISLLILGWATVVAISYSTDFSFVHPRSRSHKIMVTSTGTRVANTTPQGPQGKLLVPAESYDFGILDPRTISKHTFELQNVGEGTLKLQNLGTSCTKCTVAAMTKDTLLPGEISLVEVEFDCGPGPHYSQSVTIGVENDPSKKSVQLRVEGRVRMHLGAEPAEHTFTALDPGTQAFARSLIYSQKFDRAEVLEVKTSHPDFQAELTTVDPVDYPNIEPTWARELVVTLPKNLPSGSFSEMVWVTVRLPPVAAGEAGEITRIDVSLQGKVSRGIQISGEVIDSAGIINLGILREGVEKHVKFTLKLKNKDARDLQLQSIECTPDFLQVKVEPKPMVDPALGLYDIHVTVPANAPTCNYMRETELGQIRFVTKNPNVGELPLAVLMAIREDG